MEALAVLIPLIPVLIIKNLPCSTAWKWVIGLVLIPVAAVAATCLRLG